MHLETALCVSADMLPAGCMAGIAMLDPSFFLKPEATHLGVRRCLYRSAELVIIWVSCILE